MIPVLDLKAQYARLEHEIDAAVKRVMQSSEFVLGPAVAELEASIAAYCECKYAIGLASGTDALRLSFAALHIGAGDEVITTPFTFIATANTISHAGATPVFVDIDPRTFNLDPQKIRAAITRRTKAIVPVHLYGQPAAMAEITDLAHEHNLAVIEDCAQAIGARYHGRRAGSIGDIGCLSFYPTKNLGAYGDAGMIVTNSSELAEKIDVLRRQGGKTRYEADVLGFNSRLDSIQAVILQVKLKYLDEWNARRRALAENYDRLLQNLAVTTPYCAPDVEHVFHQYTIRARERDALQEDLKKNGIGSMVYYPIPIHLQKLYESLKLQPGTLPISEETSRCVLSLPMYPELTFEQQEQIADTIRQFYSELV